MQKTGSNWFRPVFGGFWQFWSGFFCISKLGNRLRLRFIQKMQKNWTGPDLFSLVVLHIVIVLHIIIILYIIVVIVIVVLLLLLLLLIIIIILIVLVIFIVVVIVNSRRFKSSGSDEPRRVQVLDLYCLTRFESEVQVED